MYQEQRCLALKLSKSSGKVEGACIKAGSHSSCSRLWPVLVVCLWRAGMFVKGIKACSYTNTPCPYASVCPELELSLIFLIE